MVPLAAPAAELVTVIVTVTNTPVGNTNTFTLNANLRTWTNDISSSPGSLIAETNTIAWATTNFANQITAYPLGAGLRLSVSNGNTVRIGGLPGVTMTASIGGLWGAVTYETNTVGSPTYTVRVPLTVETAANRTNIASGLVEYLNISSNSIATNAAALSNFLQRGAGPLQRITGPVTFDSLASTNANLTNGSVIYARIVSTNMQATNAILGTPQIVGGIASNLSLINSAITSSVLQISAPVPNALFYGDSTVDAASPIQAMFRADGAGGTVASNVMLGTYTFSGFGLTAQQLAARIRGIADETFTDTSARGALIFETTPTASTTPTERVRMNSYGVRITGSLSVSGSISNSTYSGTNIWAGDINFPRHDVSTLANGNNISVPFGTNVHIRLAAGALSASPTICGIIGGAITGGRDGEPKFIFNDTGYDVTLAVNTADPVPANRIATYNGADVTIADGGFATLWYDSVASRWQLADVYPTSGSATNVALTDLTDVTSGFTGLANGDILAYDAASGRWTNEVLLWRTNQLAAAAPLVLVTNAGLITISNRQSFFSDAWTPTAEDTNTVGWWRSYIGVTYDASSNVTHVADASGLGYPLKQTIAGDYPFYLTNGLAGGRASLAFDGGNDWLKTDPYSIEQPASIYFLFKSVVWNSGRLYTGLAAAGGTSTNAFIYQTSSEPYFFHRTGGKVGNGLNILPTGNWGTIKAVWDVGNSKLSVNGRAAIGGDPGGGGFGGMVIAGNEVGSFGGNIQWGEMIVRSGTDTEDYTLKTMRYLQRASGQRFNLVVLDGNSLTAGTGLGAVSLVPNKVVTNYWPTSQEWFTKNAAVGGDTTSNMIVRGATTDQYFHANNSTNILTAWEISNELFNGISTNAAYSNFVYYCQARRAAGWKVVALTVLPRTGGSPPASFEADRLNVNLKIRANYLAFSDSLADVGTNGFLGCTLCSATNTYFSDGTHLTDAGNLIVSQYITNAISRIESP